MLDESQLCLPDVLQSCIGYLTPHYANEYWEGTRIVEQPIGMSSCSLLERRMQLQSIQVSWQMQDFH